MQSLKFSIMINADRQKVWNTMLDDKTYRVWTNDFCEGSYYEGNWQKGSEIKFIGPDKKGNLQGMVSRIKENDRYRLISIEHLGMINNGIIDTTSGDVKKWTPAYENYTFLDRGGMTELKIDVQVPDEYKTMFDETWPRALNALKSLCEK